MSCILDIICLQQRFNVTSPWRSHELPIDDEHKSAHLTFIELYSEPEAMNIFGFIYDRFFSQCFDLKNSFIFHRNFQHQQSTFLNFIISKILQKFTKSEKIIQGLSTQTALPYLETRRKKIEEHVFGVYCWGFTAHNAKQNTFLKAIACGHIISEVYKSRYGKLKHKHNTTLDDFLLCGDRNKRQFGWIESKSISVQRKIGLTHSMTDYLIFWKCFQTWIWSSKWNWEFFVYSSIKMFQNNHTISFISEIDLKNLTIFFNQSKN